MKILYGILCRIYSAFIMLILLCKDRNTLYVYMWPHIGDVCYAMSYLRAYREQYEIDDVTLLITKNNLELCKSYVGTFEKTVFYDEKKLFRLGKSRFVVRFLKKLHIPIERHFICTTPYLFDDRLLHTEDFTAGLITKRVIYGLRGKVPPDYPIIPKVDSEQYRVFCAKENTVILAPYANSAKEMSVLFWTNLAKVLIEKGYEVYTNAPMGKETINNTKRLDCSIIELLAYADKAKICIALRSGLLDLIAGCSCKKIVLFNNYEFFEMYDMTAWENNDNLYQLYGEPSIDKVMDIVEGRYDGVV